MAEKENGGTLKDTHYRDLGIACYELLSEEEKREVDEEVEREVKLLQKMRKEGRLYDWFQLHNG